MDILHVNPQGLKIDTSKDGIIQEYYRKERGQEVKLKDTDRIGWYLRSRSQQLAPHSETARREIIHHGSYATDLMMNYLWQRKRETNQRLGAETCWADMILDFMKLEPFTVAVVGMKELGFDGSKPLSDIWLSEIREKAFELGLEYCPEPLASAFLLADFSIPWGSNITIASHSIPIDSHGGDLKQFCLQGDRESTYLCRNHSLDEKVRAGEIRDNGGEMFFQGSNLKMPDASQFAFMFQVSKDFNGFPPLSDVDIPLVNNTSLSDMLVEYSNREQLTFLKVGVLDHV